MKRKEVILVFLLFFLITLVFFYKTVLHGFVPFPGDLLIAEYNPWKAYSYLGYNPGSYPNKAQYFDVLRQFHPWKTFAIDQIKQGIFPFWNPYNFSGAPLLSNFQSAVFYPFIVLYLFLPQIAGWTFTVMIQPLLTLFFTYFFARKLGISSIGSMFSAISLAFSSFMSVWLEYNIIGHVILWLPLSLLAIETLLKKISILWVIIFIASIVFSLLAGHPQIFVYSLIYIAVYIVYRIFSLKRLNILDLHTVILNEAKPGTRRRLAKDLVRFFVRQSLTQNDMKSGLLFFSSLILLGIGIGAIQIIPGIELIRDSARVPHDYNFLIHKILIQPWQLIMMVVPDIFGNPATRNYWLDDTYIGKVTYIGIVPLFFVLFSFRHLRNSMIRFFASAASIVLIMVSFNPLTTFLYKFELPFISTSAPTLSVFLFCFCASLLCGFGVDIWRKEQQNIKKAITVSLPLVLIVIFLWVVTYFAPNIISDKLSDHIGAAHRNLILATFLVFVGLVLIIIGTLKKKLIYTVLILLFVFQTGDLFRFFTKFNPFVPAELVFPNAPVFEFLKKESGIDRFWGYGSAAIEANFATQYGLFSPDGYDPLYSKRYGEFIQASKNGKIATEFTRQTRSDAFITPGFGEIDLPSNAYRLKILDLLGVKYILDRVENGSSEKTFTKYRFKLIYDKDGWKVFENLKTLPRAFLVSDYKVFKSNEEFEKIFFDKNFDPSRTILLEEKPTFYSSSDPAQRGSREVNYSTMQYLNNEVIDDSSRQVPHRSGAGQARTVKLMSYEPNKIIFSTNNRTDQLLFLSDTYYPGWKAFVDDKEIKIYRANYAFRAVVVPQGKHEVKFIYDSQSFRIGVGISAISFILASVLLISLSIRPKSVTT